MSKKQRKNETAEMEATKVNGTSVDKMNGGETPDSNRKNDSDSPVK